MTNYSINKVIHPKDDTVQRIYALKASLKDISLLQLNCIGSNISITLNVEPRKVILDLNYTDSSMVEFEDAYTELLRHVRIHNLTVSSMCCRDEQGRSPLHALTINNSNHLAIH